MLSGCVHYYYAPSSLNTPLLKQKGETHVQASYSEGDYFRGFELQTAYAATKNIGVLCNFMTGGRDDGQGNLGHGTYFEPGVGYYQQIGKDWIAEGFGELGIGGVHNQYGNDYSQPQSSVTFLKASLQPEFGFTSKVLDVVFSSRISGLQYISESNNLVPGSEPDLDYLVHHRFSALIEPAITVRLGYKYVKLQAQYVRSFNLNNPELAQEVYNFNLGLHITIPPSKNHKTMPGKTNQ
jgi:hypothetical protein